MNAFNGLIRISLLTALFAGTSAYAKEKVELGQKDGHSKECSSISTTSNKKKSDEDGSEAKTGKKKDPGSQQGASAE